MSTDREARRAACKYIGLVNQGATCYMNSLLQSLYMTPRFREALYRWTYDAARDGDASECVPLQLQRLFGELQLSKQTAVSTVELTNSFGWGGLEAFQQQDVQELSRVLFDVLEEAMKNANASAGVAGGEGREREGAVTDAAPSGEGEGDTAGAQSGEREQDQATTSSAAATVTVATEASPSASEGSSGDCIKDGGSESIIDELYAGRLIDYVRCVDVDYASERTDKFLDLSLAVTAFGAAPGDEEEEEGGGDGGGGSVAVDAGEARPLTSLQQCLEAYLAPELLDGDNQYYAGEPHCRKVDAIKGLKFTHLPLVLSVQLKRFVYDFGGEYVTQKKLNAAVKFPFVLDMNRYVCRGTEEQGDGTEEPSAHCFEAFLAAQVARLQRRRERKSKAQIAVAAKEPAADAPDEDTAAASATRDVGAAADLEAGLTSTTPTAHGPPPPPPAYEDGSSLTRLDVQELLRRNGPWIYQLYGVLVHAGACTGGHYFAYVRDLAVGFPEPTEAVQVEESTEEPGAAGSSGSKVSDSSKTSKGSGWYLFNDAAVAPASIEDVRGAWGGNGSSSNAYLLLYHKVALEPTGDDIEPLKHAPDSTVPRYIVDEIERLDAIAVAKQAEEAERSSKITLKIFSEERGVPDAGSAPGTGAVVGTKERFVTTSKKATYRQLLRQLYHDMRLWEEWGEAEAEEEPTAEEEAASAGDVATAEPAPEPTAPTTATTTAAETVPAPPTEAGIITNEISATTDTHVILLPPAPPVGATAVVATSISANTPTPVGIKPRYLNRIRLRWWNYLNRAPQVPIIYHPRGTGTQTLEEMRMHDYLSLFLEVRRGAEDSSWEPYVEDGFNIALTGYVPEPDPEAEAMVGQGTAEKRNGPVAHCCLPPPKDGWGSVGGSFLPARTVRLPRSATVADLLDAICRFSDCRRERLRVLRILPSDKIDSQLSVIEYRDTDTDRAKQLLSHCHMYEGISLHYEDSQGKTIAESRALCRHAFITHNIRIDFNIPQQLVDCGIPGIAESAVVVEPEKDPLSITEPPKYSHFVNLDRRRSVQDLRRVIAAEIDVARKLKFEALCTAAVARGEPEPQPWQSTELTDFHLFTNGNRNYELKHLSAVLTNCSGFYNGQASINMLVEPLGGMPIGHCVVSLYLLRLPHYVAGIRNRPPGPNDVFPATSAVRAVEKEPVAVARSIKDAEFAGGDVGGDGDCDGEVWNRKATALKDGAEVKRMTYEMEALMGRTAGRVAQDKPRDADLEVCVGSDDEAEAGSGGDARAAGELQRLLDDAASSGDGDGNGGGGGDWLDTVNELGRRGAATDGDAPACGQQWDAWEGGGGGGGGGEDGLKDLGLWGHDEVGVTGAGRKKGAVGSAALADCWGEDKVLAAVLKEGGKGTGADADGFTTPRTRSAPPTTFEPDAVAGAKTVKFAQESSASATAIPSVPPLTLEDGTELTEEEMLWMFGDAGVASTAATAAESSATGEICDGRSSPASPAVDAEAEVAVAEAEGAVATAAVTAVGSGGKEDASEAGAGAAAAATEPELADAGEPSVPEGSPATPSPAPAPSAPPVVLSDEELAQGTAYLAQRVSTQVQEHELQLVSADPSLSFADSMTLEQCKAAALSRMVRGGWLTAEWEGRTDLVRLRDKTCGCHHPERIWRSADGQTLQESHLYMFDRRVVILQLLEAEGVGVETPAPAADADVKANAAPTEAGRRALPLPAHVSCSPPAEDVTAFPDDAVAFILQRYQRSSRSMGPMIDFCVSMAATVGEVVWQLAKLTGIEYKSLRVLVLSSSGAAELRVCDLEKMSPNGTDTWAAADAETEGRRMKELCWSCRDGSMILFQDVTEPLRPLSVGEQAAVAGEAAEKQRRQQKAQRDIVDLTEPGPTGSLYGEYGGMYAAIWGDGVVEAAETKVPIWSASSGSTSSAGDSAGAATVTAKPRPRAAEKGIRIKTKQDRERDRERESQGQEREAGSGSPSGAGAAATAAERNTAQLMKSVATYLAQTGGQTQMLSRSRGAEAGKRSTAASVYIPPEERVVFCDGDVPPLFSDVD